MKKLIHILTVVILLGTTLLTNCKPDDEDKPAPSNVRANLEGHWRTDETESQLPKGLEEISDAYIDLDPNDSSGVLISNFYRLGHTFFAKAKVSGYNLTIPAQNIDTYYIQGNGTVSENLRYITWQYTVDPGDGISNVTATYEKID